LYTPCGILCRSWRGLTNKHVLCLVHEFALPTVDRARFIDVRAGDQTLLKQSSGKSCRLVNAAAWDINQDYSVRDCHQPNPNTAYVSNYSPRRDAGQPKMLNYLHFGCKSLYIALFDPCV